jgi:hypothetical protein
MTENNLEKNLKTDDRKVNAPRNKDVRHYVLQTEVCVLWLHEKEQPDPQYRDARDEQDRREKNVGIDDAHISH